MIRAVIFDLDGTLVDSAPDLHAAACILLGELGAETLTPAQVRDFIGEGVPKLVERCLGAAGLPADGAALEGAVTRFQALYGAAPAALGRPYDGVEDMLGHLSARGLKLGVCTNKPEALARQVLEDLALDRHLHAVVGGDSTGRMKPHPQPLCDCAARLGAGTDDSLYVGDSEIDAATAKAAGVPFALYSGGYRKRPLASFEDCLICHDFAELTRHIEARAGA